MTLLDFTLWVLLVALLVGFIRTLMEKWKIREWLMAHLKWGLAVEALKCDFCTSFWIGMVISIILAITVHPSLLFVAIFSCNIR